MPLTGSVAVPTLRLSKQELDFGVCLVGQEQELQIMLTNPSESISAWVAEKGKKLGLLGPRSVFIDTLTIEFPMLIHCLVFGRSEGRRDHFGCATYFMLIKIFKML